MDCVDCKRTDSPRRTEHVLSPQYRKGFERVNVLGLDHRGVVAPGVVGLDGREDRRLLN